MTAAARPADDPAVDPTIDTVVFDLGGVLLGWDPREAYREILPESEIEDFFTEIDFPAWNRGLDAGAPIARAEAELGERFPHRAELIREYRRNFPRTLTGELEGVPEIVRELAASGVRLLALTNWSAETFPHALERFEVLGQFEAILVSGREQLAKPDPAIFLLLIDRYQLDPASTAYIDDSAANVAAATELGLRALQFHGAADLRARLGALGLPVAP